MVTPTQARSMGAMLEAVSSRVAIVDVLDWSPIAGRTFEDRKVPRERPRR
jgi:hypothetical protein